jgi:uncharacterized phage protein (TIGR02218 family)
VTDDFIVAEKAESLAPVELFHIWEAAGAVDDLHWYYTSGDAPISHEGNTYEPVAIERSSLSYDSELEVTTMTVTVGALRDEMRDYLVQNPMAQTWVSVLRVHRGAGDTSVVFIGQVRGLSFQGAAAEAECVGFEHFLKMKIPTIYFQPSCNNIIFDNRCGLNKNNYAVTTTATGDGKGLSAEAFGSKPDGFFNYGWMEYGRQKRMVVSHNGTGILLQYPFTDWENGSTVTVYAGCDQRITTCRDRFNNVKNFYGTPYVPIENPSTAMS